MAAACANQENATGEQAAADREQEDATDGELDAVEIFKECHTSRKKGLTDIAKEAIANMKALKDQPLAEGSALVSSAQVVSKVLPKNSSNIFLKNIGLQPTSLTKPPTAKERALQEQLVAEKHASAILQDEVNVLKQNFHNIEEALERTQMELQEYKKAMENKKAAEENNLLLKRLLLFNCGGNVSGPSS